MPAAEGAVAAAAVADQMYGPKEDRKLAIVLVLFILLEWIIPLSSTFICYGLLAIDHFLRWFIPESIEAHLPPKEKPLSSICIRTSDH